MQKIISHIVFLLYITISGYPATAQSRTPLYSIVVGRDGFYGTGNKNYTSIEVYLNNNSNDTLMFRSADCSNLLFSLNNNPYFHLAEDFCQQRTYIKAVLPPHRSEKMELYLTMDQNPDRDVRLHFNMELYRWTNNAADTHKGLLKILSDSIVLHYNKNHQQYSLLKEIDLYNEKASSILPNKDIYLITNNDSKLYTLTIESANISVPRDTILKNYKNKKFKKYRIITLPAVFRNESNDTLNFYSMTCSWEDFWDTNRSDVVLLRWPCENNMPKIIAVAPHQVYKRTLTIFYNTEVKRDTQYRISMSLLRYPTYIKHDVLFWPSEYVRFNKIWSNEISIP